MALDTNRIIEYLWTPIDEEKEVQVYAVVDAARDKAIHGKLAAVATSEEIISLFRGEKAVELARVAPYLIKLQRESPFTRKLIDEGWGNGWGIFLVSEEDFIQLRSHCRLLLEVYDEEGNAMLFRYYDPKVLQVYLPTCTAQELKLFFGPVHHVVLEEDPAVLLRYENREGKLDIQKVQ